MTFYYTTPNLLPKTDKRYKKWLKSLKNRPAPWNKGLTKENNYSVAKISETLKRKGINNFATWQKQQKKLGLIRSKYPSLRKSGDLAELVGVSLGDGHVEKFPRTELLAIFSNEKNKGFIKRYSLLIEKIFNKEASIIKHGNGCTKISIYQKNISKRIGIASGSRGKLIIKIPEWIKRNKKFLRRYLRGLYEAEGSFCVHKGTYTYKFLFSNRNESLLGNVYEGMSLMGFHPHRSKYQIQISKKAEVYSAIKLLEFRKY